jgi:HEPN domain-containing protein
MVSDEINTVKYKRGKEIALIKENLSLGIPLDCMLITSNECISNFRNHNPLFLDIAWEGMILADSSDFLRKLIEETRDYIFYKKLEKLPDGWRFPVLYRQATYLSDVSNKDFAVVMLIDGERDFNIGSKLIEDEFYDKAVYHFQQAVEKSIKSILIAFGEFKKSHFVGEVLKNRLKDMEVEQGWKEKLSSIAGISEEIEPEVTWSRYPGIDNGQLWTPYEEYTLEYAVEVQNKSKEVVQVAKDFIRWWFK